MKHIGIVGVSAEGASLCYKTIVSESSNVLGENVHPEITLNNPPFSEILKAQKEKDWKMVAIIILSSIGKMKKAGADFVVIPANSVHFAINELKAKSKLPIISIVDVTVQKCHENNFKKVLILGVGITMSEGLYNESLKKEGIKPVIPNENEQVKINYIIYKELVQGKFNKKSTDYLLELVGKYKKLGCDAVILGCTELPLVLNEANCPIPIIDTTEVLAQAAVRKALL